MKRTLLWLPLVLACASDPGVRIPGDLRIALLDATIDDRRATHVDTIRHLYEAQGIDEVDLVVETEESAHRLRVGSAALRAALMGREITARLDDRLVSVRVDQAIDGRATQEVELTIENRNTPDVLRIHVERVGVERRPRMEVSRPDDSPPVNEEQEDVPIHDWAC